MILRPYQTEAVAAMLDFSAKCLDPCLVEAATGAGKSLMIAELARLLYDKSGGKSLICLAPSVKLIKQNREKFLKTGHPASVYSASANSKCLRHPVVFATPMSVLNSIDYVVRGICAIILDEAHTVTPTILEIINKLREKNPLIRVFGFTATPYRNGEGFIYAIDVDGDPVDEDKATAPYFKKLVYRITKRELETQGYLTPAMIVDTCAENYDLSTLPRGANDDKSNAVYLGQGRATAQICAEIAAETQGLTSVMIFAATVRHAQEIAASFRADQVRVIGGEINMLPKVREKIENDFEKGVYKYLVSVGTMTTGVDFPDVEAVVIMRRIESLTLLEQIIGRGSRLPVHSNKPHFLLFDYADNLETHYGEEVNLYEPQVVAKLRKKELLVVPSLCTSCGFTNNFAARPNLDRLPTDTEGYFLDLEGNRIVTEHGPMPGHFGRRCNNHLLINRTLERCGHRWTDKKCPECAESNDIAARYCKACKAEIVDPNKKLVIEFKKYKRNPSNVHCDKVLELHHGPWIGANNVPCVKVHVQTEYRVFDFYLFPNSGKRFFVAKYEQFMTALEIGISTITYHKNRATGYFEVHDYNKPYDEV